MIFGEGQYVEVVAGQSFHLAGNNAYAAPNPYQTGIGSGLETPTSDAVLGLYAVPVEGSKVGGKLQIDTVDPEIRRAQLGATYTDNDGWQAAPNYHYSGDIPAAGIGTLHEIGAELTVPVTEYWSLTGIGYWDLQANTWLRVGGGLTHDDGYLTMGLPPNHTSCHEGLTHDDGYLTMGATITRNGSTHLSANDTRIMATFALKAPAGFNAGYSGAVALPNFGVQ